MTIDRLLAMYEKGAITGHHLVAQCLIKIDPEDPALVLDVLPVEILTRMVEFVGKYQPTQPMISTYGASPTTDQVNSARRWIEMTSKVASAASSRA